MIQLKDKKDCCGCEACVQRCPKKCIAFKEDEEGFLYPYVNLEHCVDCGLCNQVCPVLCPGEERKPLQVFAAKNLDEEIRRQSSSGGVFTLLAERVLQEGGVVFGARFNSQWEVVHDYTETLEGLAAFRGSKYVQSRIEDNYQRAEYFLKKGRRVLFSGTPCQVAGLKLFLREEYENLLTVDFICHGVPSPGVWREYLKKIAARRAAAGKNTVLSAPLNNRDDFLSRIASISFRDKVLGWKKFSFVVRGSATDGAEQNSVLLSEDLNTNLFLKGFLADLYLRPSCHACPVKSGKSGSDITIGDFWGIWDVLPEFFDDNGVSCVLLNTERGRNNYECITLNSQMANYRDIVIKNPAVCHSAKLRKRRSDFYQHLGSRTLELCIIRYSKPSLYQRCFVWTIHSITVLGLKQLVKKLINRI